MFDRMKAKIDWEGDVGTITWDSKLIGILDEMEGRQVATLFIEDRDFDGYPEWTPPMREQFRYELPEVIKGLLEEVGAVAREPWPGRRGL
jgi:hypothetical protein